jgi:hypothetical protein
VCNGPSSDRSDMGTDSEALNPIINYAGFLGRSPSQGQQNTETPYTCLDRETGIAYKIATDVGSLMHQPALERKQNFPK